jgi:hypothetical protein
MYGAKGVTPIKPSAFCQGVSPSHTLLALLTVGYPDYGTSSARGKNGAIG